MSTQSLTTSAAHQATPGRLVIYAPLAGSVYPLEQVPDPVFAEKMIGDGISIDPVDNVLLAPFDGVVQQLHSSGHAVTIKHASGLEVLLHIGIDTVLLKGKGFKPLVSTGTEVSKGTPLIEFAADDIACQAKSLMTEIILANGELVKRLHQPSIDDIEAMAPLLEVELQNADTGESETETGEWLASRPLLIPNPSGLHARPCATLVQLAKQFSAHIELECHGQRVNGRSLTAIMALNIRLGDAITLFARGAQASIALEQLSEAVQSGLGEDVTQVNTAAAIDYDQEPSLLFPPSDDPNRITGTSASAGLAFGRIFQRREERFEYPEQGGRFEHEIVMLDQCLYDARLQLVELEQRLIDAGQPERAQIFVAHQELLSDPDLYDHATADVRAGKSAAFAWQTAVNMQVNRLKKLNNPMLAERAADLQDVGRRVLKLILGLSNEEQALPENTILVAEDLTPSDTANIDLKQVIGICTTGGGPTSHTAILARAMNLPALAGVERRVLELANGTEVILDADNGNLQLTPDSKALEDIRLQLDTRAQQHQANLEQVALAATTRDGHTIAVAANAGSTAEVTKAITGGADGIGLLRSEFLFLQCATAPDEEEQYRIYRQALETLQPGQPLIVRTLDVGGDKPLPYLPLPAEDNPFLGQRGIRIGLDKPLLLRQQLRAILRASEHGAIHILLPMISSLHELRLTKELLEQERQSLGVAPVPVGIMIEVPSAALMADVLAAEADFFSIGTNDLTQYTLAMDRGHPKLAPLIDALDPAVLRLIKQTCDGAQKHDKWVGICGGVAGDPLATALLVGLGVTELSVSIPVVADVKANIRNLDFSDCRRLADQALMLSSASEVRQLITNSFNK
ncbi:phosphoenolpyruvate--protein phosphotransferase [Gynuella sp.]|uniref:phosphoenolpyruvate--protein phosphotransferase n=1 Tax=Gynuella sp. TaxID=2969146 RepID=UPI003D0C6C35